MHAAARENARGLVPASQKAALVSLLVDEDPAVYQVIRNKLLSIGPEVCDWLRPHTLSSDPVLRRRCLEIIHRLARGRSDDRFLDFCLHHGEELDLERGVFLLAQTQYPDINPEAYGAMLDLWARDIQDRLDRHGPAEAVLGGVNRYLFGDLEFSGNPHYGDNQENCYVNRVMDRRTGNPISLCVIYLFLARRLGLPVAGIGLPGHFICRYQSSTRQVYIDVFRRGQFLSKADCIRYLLQTYHGLQEGYLSPVSPRRMLLRICSNLHQTYSLLEMTEEVTRVQRYLVALAK
ncbi:MAG: transglutaminase family protein [Verrucomicrobia bacterium]|nr:transglutaminase family protein [Verrucomicrobiota bacterium]